MIGIVYDERMQLHHHPEDDPLNDYCAKTDHPESPLRISSIYDHLNARGLVERCASVPAVSALRSDLVRAHGAAHCDFVASLSSAAVRDALGNALFDESSVYVNDHTPMAASLSAGSVVALTEAVVDGRLDAGFAIVRPPGHHAEPGACHGFCLYNNVAVAAKAARERMDVAVSFVRSLLSPTNNRRTLLSSPSSFVIFVFSLLSPHLALTSLHFACIFPFEISARSYCRLGYSSRQWYTANVRE